MNYLLSSGCSAAWLARSVRVAEVGGSNPLIPTIFFQGGKMLSNLPIDLSKVKKENIDKEILRAGIIAELDAINLYEQFAAMTENSDIRKVVLDIAKEEKTHVGEFQALLLKLDNQQVTELEEGRKEVEKELSK
jgi:rubrerythrin